MNYIGLDISKISTALVIETNGVEHIFSYNTQKSDAKWNENIKGIATIRTYEYDNVEGDYSKSEINKLQQFSKISGDILCDINDTIDNFDEIVLYLEGYSYGKNAGPLIDLVGIGSIIRTKIYEDISNIKEIKIIAPKSLKLMTAELVYGSKMVEIGKRVKRTEKVINPNNDGVSGGSFDKKQMFQAIIDYKKGDNLYNYCMNYYEDIIKMKSIPKPLEDIIDAYLLKEIIFNKNQK